MLFGRLIIYLYIYSIVISTVDCRILQYSVAAVSNLFFFRTFVQTLLVYYNDELARARRLYVTKTDMAASTLFLKNSLFLFYRVDPFGWD